MQTNPEEQNFLDLSDDEIMGMTAPPAGVATSAAEVVTEVEPEEEEVETETAPEPEVVEEEPVEEADPEADQRAADEAVLGAADDAVAKPDPVAAKKPVDKVADPAAKVEEPAKPVVEEPAAPVMTMEQRAEAFDKLMNFKANGKEIKLNSVDEALKLQQMGANYTKNMQLLQPMKRLFKMLDNNKLTDPAQLSYLIDLHQRKPEAIQKLLADSKFDPHTVDAEKAAQYQPGAHQVSDVELEFETALQEVEASETGPELLREVTKQWDQESRRALFQQPRLLTELNSQKSLGFYGKIQAEIERRKMLGDLQGVPFLAAYEAVGKELQQQGLLWPKDAVATPAPTPAAVVPEPQKREPVATRVATPAKKLANSDKAAAASAPKANPSSAVKAEPNFLDMPDSEFLKQMDGRL